MTEILTVVVVICSGSICVKTQTSFYDTQLFQISNTEPCDAI